jgi:hypothetical protein
MPTTGTPSTFAAYLHTARELPWFTEYVCFMGGVVFRPADTRGERPAPAWDHWLRVGVRMEASLAPAFIAGLPTCVIVPSTHGDQKMPTEAINE